MELPKFDDLPNFHEFTGCAWSVWGEDDQLGTVNLLTEKVVANAAKEEIRTGKSVSLNWPLHLPENPLYQRKGVEVNTHIHPLTACCRDDELTLNTQAGTQWDGLRHFGIIKHGVLYKNTDATSVPPVAKLPTSKEQIYLGIQNLADHGISGRGVLLDLVSYYGETLPYDPWTAHSIPVSDLAACAVKQGVNFRPGDILLLRIGFIKQHMNCTSEERAQLSQRGDTYAGIEQSEEMKRFLWDNHFAAVASDQPALERWPPPGDTPHLHQTLLGLWGMPIGELFDLEKLSEVCREQGRYTFFFASWPLNIHGGAASTANAAAYF